MAIDKIFNDANVDGIADNIFGAVNNSVSEVKQMQQRKAAENVQMVVEAFKKIETNITEKFDNVTDVIEKRVLTIKDGRDGLSGSDGRNGRDGKPGRDGVNGKQGIPGTPGKDGVDGVNGVSVTDANIDFDGSLVISLSSGQQINVGEVVSPDLADKIQVISTMSTNGAVGIKDEGTSISSGVKIINFVGANITATNSGDDVTVTVAGSAGTVTSVAATVPSVFSISGSPITTSGTLALTYSGTALPVANGGTGLTTGTSGGVLAYTAAGTLASSTALAANALVVGGGAGAAPSTTTTGTGVVTALGVNTGTAGAFVVNGGALGTPSSGIVTNLTGTASININGTVGATTPATGAFTTLSATGTLSGGTSGTGYSFSGSAPAGSLALDSSGNLGLGVTPATYSGSGVLGINVAQTGNGILGNSSNTWVSNNVSFNTGFKYARTTTATLYNQSGGSHVWSNAVSGTAGNAITFTDAMTLDSSGNLGIGTASPSSRLHVSASNGDVARIAGTTRSLYFGTDSSGVMIATGAGQTGVGTYYSAGSDFMYFMTGSTERARIDSSGNLLVGTTSASLTNTTSQMFGGGANNYSIFSHINGTSSGAVYHYFAYNGSSIGSITQSGTTAVLYNTTSDQRLKENIQDADSASSLIDSLQVRQFDWKSDNSHQRYGFIAQELVTVVPEAVHQPADTEEMMAVDYSKLVPMLVKEIQSLRQRLSAANL